VKPHEETDWEAEDFVDVWFDSRPEVLNERLARQRLASAAPDMARVLLEIEYSPNDGIWFCPSCDCRVTDGHAPDCALDAALRKAGVRAATQAAPAEELFSQTDPDADPVS